MTYRQEDPLQKNQQELTNVNEEGSGSYASVLPQKPPSVKETFEATESATTLNLRGESSMDQMPQLHCKPSNGPYEILTIRGMVG